MRDSALLLSGGIDSTALAVWCRPNIAITIDYGQVSANGEIRAARQVASTLSIPHETVRVDCSCLGSGDLAGVPALACAPEKEWWPYRNQFLVTVAAMRGISLGVKKLLIGSVKSDAFHVDGRAEFYEHLDSLLSMQEGGIRVEAPALHVSTVELVRLSTAPLSLLGWTHSCHKAEFACGNCRGCRKHASVLDELGYGNP
jgi:7-cyano-7-deazaguanine synthase